MIWFRKTGRKGKIPLPSERANHFLESVLHSISDIQILLALALALSVVVFGICRTLQYHFEVAVNLLLLACANYLQALGFTPKYWRSWPAAMADFLKLLGVVGIYLCFGWMMALQNDQHFADKHRFVAERMPAKAKIDSAILLKAACFLDPVFQNNTFMPLDEAQRAHIGLEENNGKAAEWILGLMLGVATLIILVIRFVTSFGHSPKNLMKKTAFHYLYYAPIWLLSLVVFCYSANTILGLRSWVSESGWVQLVEKGNPENNVRGFGQTAALLLMVAMLLGALKNTSTIMKRAGKRNAKGKKASKGKHRKDKEYV
ncbi:MAG: hypothetical protein Q9214_003374 [Letrouitia sp. 1 TL-2023]